MEKEFVTYEQAKSLKGLKFDEPCFGYYEDVEVPNPFLVITKISDTQGGYFTFAPLKQQVFRWFRDKYDLFISITHYGNGYSINDLRRFDTYEEAENACIDKLIELVK
jgi:hypothetical protein